MYFPCSRRQFGLAGPSLLEVGHDERESDGMLASALGVCRPSSLEFFISLLWNGILLGFFVNFRSESQVLIILCVDWCCNRSLTEFMRAFLRIPG